MTYNIHAGRGLDGVNDLGRIAEVIGSYRPHVVALQEVDVGRARSCGVDQAAVIATRLGMQACFAPCMENGPEQYGIATLARVPISATRILRLPGRRHRRSEPRCALITTLEFDGGELDLINTHLSVLFRERPGQVAAIAESQTDGALVIAGDFNCTPLSPAYRALSRGLRSATWFARSWPSPAPIVPIDHILYRGDLRVIAAGPWTRGPARIASDHLPIVAELQRGAR
jgi:endonuclease/exonuclease/phosphatase family metal-dependent hydrolase